MRHLKGFHAVYVQDMRSKPDRYMHFDINSAHSTWKSVIANLTGAPASPGSPFLPRLPLFPGGPGGPRNKEETH